VTVLRDVRYGVRMLAGKPGFTAAAVLVLALGIGANTAIFSLVNAFLLKPLPVEHPEQLVGCYSRDTKKPDSYRGFSYPNYADLRENNAVFTSLMAHNLGMVGLIEGDGTRRVFADIVSSNYFATFGVPLWRGRPFTLAEERPGSDVPVVILSYQLWESSGADPEVLGKTRRINGRTYTVVGIAPKGFTGSTALVSPALYLPLGMYESAINDFEGRGRKLASRDHYALILVGRLRPGMTAQSADRQLAVAAARLESAFPAENKNQTFMARPLSRLSISTNPSNDGGLAVPAIMLVSVASVVLLIASLNVANMMLVRATARRKEIAIRLALGGARKHILRQLFTEGLLLAGAGGAAGLAVAYWSTTALVRSMATLAPLDLVYNAGPDVRVLLATLSFCVFSTVLFGVIPAWGLGKRNLVPGLKDGDSEESSGGKRKLFSRRNVLVMGQVALSLVLLSAAGLFVRSSTHAARVDPGFGLDRRVLLEVDASLAGYDETHGRQVYRTLLDRLRNIPGVESASVAATVPFGIVSLGRGIRRSDTAAGGSGKDGSTSCRLNIVGQDYFRTLGIPLLRGRSFAAAETGDSKSSAVAVLDKAAADRLWPHEDALGKHIRTDSEDPRAPRDLEVIGVVAEIQENLIGEAVQPHLYVPFGQEYQADMNVHLKVAATASEAQVLDIVRRTVRLVDDRLPVLALKTMRAHLDSSFDIWLVRTGARMFAIFGGVALMLAMVGLYGVRAYTVARRTREIGIRMALGAHPANAQAMILREGLILTAIGAGAGLLLSAAVGKVLASQLYQVSAADPLVFLGAPAVLAAVSLLACYVPARRAARVDPMVALRYE